MTRNIAGWGAGQIGISNAFPKLLKGKLRTLASLFKTKAGVGERNILNCYLINSDNIYVFSVKSVCLPYGLDWTGAHSLLRQHQEAAFRLRQRGVIRDTSRPALALQQDPRSPGLETGQGDGERLGPWARRFDPGSQFLHHNPCWCGGVETVRV